jgi:hypothetical protein
MRKTKLTLYVLSMIAIPAAGAHASFEVRPFAPNLDATAYARQVMSDQSAQGVRVPGLMLASGEVREVIHDQVRTRVETGEFGESDLGDKNDNLPGTKPDDDPTDNTGDTTNDPKDDTGDTNDDSKDDNSKDDSGQHDTGDSPDSPDSSSPTEHDSSSSGM